MSVYHNSVRFFDGTTKSFTDPEVLKEWVQNELSTWQEFKAKTDHQNLGNMRHEFNQDFQRTQISLLSQMLSNFDASKNHSVDFGQHYIGTETTLGQTILTVANDDPVRAIMMIASVNPTYRGLSTLLQTIYRGVSDNDMELIHKHIRGIVENSLVAMDIFEKADSNSKAVKKITQQYKDSLQANEKLRAEDIEKSKEYSDQFQQFVLDTKSEKDASFAALKEEMDGVRKLYKEELALKIPVTYWTEKGNEHALWAKIWAVVFVASAVTMVFGFSHVLGTVVHTVMAIFSDQQDQAAGAAPAAKFEDLRPWVLFISISFPMFIGIWFLRLAAKTMISHQNQMNDARMRTVMTNTFLALMNEGKANENDKILILNALFHVPQNTNDDGSPPHWFELLQARFGKGTV